MNSNIENLIIRQFRESDKDEVYNLIRTAFETAKVRDGDEQDFAVGLRTRSTYIPELEFIGEIDNKPVAHIMLTKTSIIQPDNKKVQILLLAPLSVLLEYRSKGIGAAMVSKGFDQARKLGYKAIILCGDPTYYERLGFRSISAFEFRNGTSIPNQFVLVYELVPDALKNVGGTIVNLA